MDRRTDLALLVLRLAAGGMLFYGHGLGKAQRLLAGDLEFGDPLGLGAGPSLALAAFAEALCAPLVALGVKTRWTAVPPLLTMVVAAAIAHAGDPFATREKALLFAAAFLTLVLAGGGRYALDAALRRRRARRSAGPRLR